MNKNYSKQNNAKKYYEDINPSLLNFCSSYFFLRPIVYEDLETIFAWRNDPLVNKYLTSPPPKDMNEQEQWYRKYIQNPECIYFMTTKRVPEDIKVGYCQLLKIDRHRRSAEYGVVVGAGEYFGKGLGLKLIITLVKIAFSCLRFRILYANINPGNMGSKRIVKDFLGSTIVNSYDEVYSKSNEELFRIEKEVFESFEIKLVGKSKKWMDILNINQIESCGKG